LVRHHGDGIKHAVVDRLARTGSRFGIIMNDQKIRNDPIGFCRCEKFLLPVAVSAIGGVRNRPDLDSRVHRFHGVVVIGEIIAVNRAGQGTASLSLSSFFPTAVNLIADFPIFGLGGPIGQVRGDPGGGKANGLGMCVLGAAPITAEIHDSLHLPAKFLKERNILGCGGSVTAYTLKIIPIHDVGIRPSRPADVTATGNLHGGHVSGIRAVVRSRIAGHIGPINFRGNRIHDCRSVDSYICLSSQD